MSKKIRRSDEHAEGDVGIAFIFRPGGFDELDGEMRQAAAAGTLDEKQRQVILTKWGVHFDKDSRL